MTRHLAWALGGFLSLALVAACSASDGGKGNRKPSGGGPDGGGPGGNGDGGGSGGSDGSTNFTDGGGFGGMGGGGSDAGGITVDPMQSPFKMDVTGQTGVPSNTVKQLKKGGSGSFEIIYPYEGTVFPVGLPAPVIQWRGQTDAAYVHVKYQGSDKVEYEYANGSTDPGRIQIPRKHWNKIAARTPETPLQVTVSIKQGGNIKTAKTQWNIAPGTFDGTLFYNTYNAPSLSSGPGVQRGAVMRMQLGGQAEPYIRYEGAPNVTQMTGPCKSCHSVSANGNVLQATYHDYNAIPGMPKEFRADVYDLQSASSNNPAPATEGIPGATFGALTPNGGKILAMGNPGCTGGADTFPRHPRNFPLVEGPRVAELRNAGNGQKINASGLKDDWYMWMPQFSPQGNKVVFNHARPGGPHGRTERRTLAVMDFDNSSNTFSNLRVVYENNTMPSEPYSAYTATALGGPIACDTNQCDGSEPWRQCQSAQGLQATYPDTCSEPCYPGWPFFTPDGKRIIFALGNQPDFVSAAPGGRPNPADSELWTVNLETGKAQPLHAANGRNPDGSVYLPDKNHVQREYYPTVMPVSTGGYYWVFWTSRRNYGHINPGGAEVNAKKIWVSAIDIPSSSGELQGPDDDPSHPAFYLPGQSDSGNVRAFVALDPCKQTGNNCQTGLDCCTGFCNIGPNESVGQCIEEPDRCARQKEKCSSDADCCETVEGPDGERALHCIGGRCDIMTLK